jgi:hypothetical protein
MPVDPEDPQPPIIAGGSPEPIEPQPETRPDGEPRPPLTFTEMKGLPTPDILAGYKTVILTPEQMTALRRKEADRLRKQRKRQERREAVEKARAIVRSRTSPINIDSVDRGKFMTDAPEGKGLLISGTPPGNQTGSQHIENMAGAAMRATSLGAPTEDEPNDDGSAASYWPEHDRRKAKPRGAGPDDADGVND